jgi:LysM repeat protein
VTPTDLFTSDTTTSSCIYIVQPGDNLFRIAVSNDVTLDELRAANPDIVGDLIQPNDEIILPDCDETAAPTTGTQAPAPEGTAAPGEQIIHVVVAGETLSTIAQQYGVTVLSIVQANNLTDPNRLSVGQQLTIP